MLTICLKINRHGVRIWKPGAPSIHVTSFSSIFIWETRLGKGSFQMEVLTLVQNITENRLRVARGPVHFYIESVTFISLWYTGGWSIRMSRKIVQVQTKSEKKHWHTHQWYTHQSHALCSTNGNELNRQTDRQTDRPAGGQEIRLNEKPTNKEKEGKKNRQTDRKKEKRQTERRRKSQTDKLRR